MYKIYTIAFISCISCLLCCKCTKITQLQFLSSARIGIQIDFRAELDAIKMKPRLTQFSKKNPSKIQCFQLKLSQPMQNVKKCCAIWRTIVWFETCDGPALRKATLDLLNLKHKMICVTGCMVERWTAVRAEHMFHSKFIPYIAYYGPSRAAGSAKLSRVPDHTMVRAGLHHRQGLSPIAACQNGFASKGRALLQIYCRKRLQSSRTLWWEASDSSHWHIMQEDCLSRSAVLQLALSSEWVSCSSSNICVKCSH